MSRHTQATGTKRPRGFTLVELLVVIGIIALLISILLPSLTRARESANRVKCLSNMRQIVGAMMAFAAENKGRMPTQAGGGVFFLDSAGVYRPVTAATIDNIRNPSDWIAWMRTRDAVGGGTFSGAANQNITYSALAKFLGARVVDHVDADEANRVNPTLESVFRCPSDNLAQRNSIDSSGAASGRGPYRYSYSMNRWYAGNNVGDRFDGRFSGKISSIRSPSTKILLVCEDEQTIDDGVFNPNPANFLSGGQINAVAARHEGRRADARNFVQTTLQNKNALGNVGFADGHVEFFSRKDALRQRHTGNPTPDPVGF
jgi:prepilin-type N-terminal cleavage/methylation domain-containing protein/prepilin-type processing-associated H-X9-DG protein